MGNQSWLSTESGHQTRFRSRGSGKHCRRNGDSPALPLRSHGCRGDQTGTFREGVYSGIASLLRQLSTFGALFQMGGLLEQAGYRAGADQSAQTPGMMRFLIGPLPALLYILSMLFLLRYPIDQRYHGRMQKLLAIRRRRHVD